MARSSLADRHFDFLAQLDAAANASPEGDLADRSEVRRASKSGVIPAVPRHLHAVDVHGAQGAAPVDAAAVRTDAPIEPIVRIGKLPNAGRKVNERRRAAREVAAADLDAAITEAGASNEAVARPLDIDESAVRALRRFADEKAHADGDVGAMPASVGEVYYRRRYLRAIRKQRAGQPAKPVADVALEAVEIVSMLPRAVRATDPCERKAARQLVTRLLASALDLLDSLEGS
jgi:hypothetical protein